MESLSAIMSGLSMAGSTMSAYGKYQAGKTQQEVYDYNAQVIQNKTTQEENVSRERLKLLMGRQRALYAKAGVDLSSGSPLLVLAQTALKGEEEAQRISTAGRSEAGLQRLYGESAYKSGVIGGISDFLGGMGQAGMNAYSAGMFKKQKVRIT